MYPQKIGTKSKKATGKRALKDKPLEVVPPPSPSPDIFAEASRAFVTSISDDVTMRAEDLTVRAPDGFVEEPRVPSALGQNGLL